MSLRPPPRAARVCAGDAARCHPERQAPRPSGRSARRGEEAVHTRMVVQSSRTPAYCAERPSLRHMARLVVAITLSAKRTLLSAAALLDIRMTRPRIWRNAYVGGAAYQTLLAHTRVTGDAACVELPSRAPTLAVATVSFFVYCAASPVARIHVRHCTHVREALLRKPARTTSGDMALRLHDGGMCEW